MFMSKIIFFFFFEFKKNSYHIAIKSIPTINKNGEKINPKDENGIKMELFNFDVCQFADDIALLYVDRKFEFSPLKNQKGNDSPESCLKDFSNVNSIYIEKAGGKIIKTDETNIIVEISPLLSLEGENLETIVKDKEFKSPIYLQ
jgi:UDP-N-acetylglucosamine/UDP-N-acetylgalactosamine diphosphorylase